MALTPIYELGVDEAYMILVNHFRVDDLPSLEVIEYEDWGRDLILSRLSELSPENLERVGLSLSQDDRSIDSRPSSRGPSGNEPE